MTDLCIKSTATLELPAVLSLLAGEAVSEEAKARSLALRPSVEEAEVRFLQSQTSAARAMMDKKGEPSFREVRPVAPALARAEIKQEATTAGKGVGMMAGAGAFAAVAMILISFAAAEGLQRWLDIDLAWCYFIVAVVWLIVAGVLFSMGRKKLSEVNPKPERTVDSLRDVADTLKGQS